MFLECFNLKKVKNMAITYGKKKYKQHYILYTFITAILLCVVFLTMVSFLYVSAEKEAYENLHVQTKQIKDDISLQLISDRENLSTMANFAANLYSEDERYDIMFQSFKPIGLIENIGILNEDNTFVTKTGVIDVSGVMSFEEEVKKGLYISSRVSDITTRGKEIVRSAVPITADGKTVGILYGVIQLDKIAEKYNNMAADLEAQLFVYDKASGDLIIDNVHDKLGNISFLKDRKYNDNYSYEQMAGNDKGFTSFVSAYKDENAYLHYSTIEDIGWMIAMARYDSQVFAQAKELSNVLVLAFFVMLVIIVMYIITLMTNERKINAITSCASDIRKTLLETSGNQNNIVEALKMVCDFSKAGSAIFFDTDGEEYSYISTEYKDRLFSEDERNYFKSELFRYAAEFHKLSKTTVNILSIKTNKHLVKTNITFYEFLKANKITEISFSATINNSNHITILAAINSKRDNLVRILAEKIAACFSMALYNKNYLNKTKLVATTDSLTGALNRVAYKNDLVTIEEENIENFSCIYVDVNELHFINNNFGHAVGDQMLLYIANTLKEVFYGHKVYRMGGDEFLVFCQNTEQEVVKKSIDIFVEQLKPKNYHVAVGFAFRTHNTDTEKIVKEAEKRMYDAKAQYYQNKQQQNLPKNQENEYIQVKTGILEIDTMLSILKESYNGIYRVSLDSDKARRILMPAYLKYNEKEEHFSSLFSKYVSEIVEPDYHRAVMSFLNYDAIKQQLIEGKIPKITYKKNNSEIVTLSVYKLCDTDVQTYDTLWVFAKG
jgi:diguanylate cyclase (GGDEF)-like protein